MTSTFLPKYFPSVILVYLNIWILHQSSLHGYTFIENPVTKSLNLRRHLTPITTQNKNLTPFTYIPSVIREIMMMINESTLSMLKGLTGISTQI